MGLCDGARAIFGAPPMLGTPCVSFRSPLLNRHENPKKLETFVREKRARENKKKAANASTATVAAAGNKIPGTMSKAATLAGPTVPKAQPVAVPTVPKPEKFGPPVHL